MAEDETVDLRSDDETAVPVQTLDPAVEKRRVFAEQLDGAMENRRFAVSDIEVRDTSDGGLRFTGYASTTETPYEVGDFTETIARGAFKRTLNEGPDVVLLVNHEGLPLARTKAGTLSLAEDSRGLRVDADLDPERTDVKDLARAMGRRDIDQMSFAFRVTDQQWNQDYSERLIRSLTIHRGDVSIVTMGANPATSSQVVARSEDGLLEVRAGKAISDANMAKIQHALDLVAEADRAVDKAQPLLADVAGVPNPDEPEDEDTPARMVVIPDHTSIARAEFDLLVARSKS